MGRLARRWLTTGRSEHVADIDRFHAGGEDRLDAHVRVFLEIGVQCGEDTTGRREHDAVRWDLRLLGRTRAYASARSLSRTFAFPARFSEVFIIEVGLHGVVECRRPCPSVVEHTGYQQTSRA